MKLRNAFEFAGLRSRTRHYDYRMRSVDLHDGRHAAVAEWQHPRLLDGRDRYESLAEFARRYDDIIDKGDFCIDIGAHAGDTTLPMAIAAGTDGCVLALEPNPFVYHVLEKNARANRHIANIRTMMAAAGSYQGFMEFEYSDSGYCNGGRHEGISALQHGHPYKLSVFCVDLQQELHEHFADELRRLKLIKVDAEGYDLFVLRSLLGIIDEYRPIVKAEVFKKTSRQYREELFDLFDRRGYEIYGLSEEPIIRGDRLDRLSTAASGHFDILCFPQ